MALVSGQVLRRDQAAALLDRLCDLRRHRSVIKISGIFCDALQRGRQFRLTKSFSRAVEIAITLKDVPRRGKLRQQRIMHLLGFFFAQHKSIARQPNRRLHHLRQRQLAPQFFRPHHARNRSRNADAAIAHGRCIGNHIALRVQIHIHGGRARSFLPIIHKV